MTPAEVTGIARAVAQSLDEFEARLVALGDQVQAMRAERADPIAAVLLDAEGTLHVVQRTGERLTVRLPDVAALVAAAGENWREQVRTELRGELQASVARTFEIFCNAPAWSPTTVYTEGQVVQAHVGRTYRVRAGVRATLGQPPGDHSEQWERLGMGGFRVLKNRPAQLEAGDIFTEAEARFMHDGAQTILFVPKGAKVSDIERGVKAPHALAQAAHAQLREIATRVEDLERVQRVAANDDGTQALAQLETLRAELEALRRRLDDLDDVA